MDGKGYLKKESVKMDYNDQVIKRYGSKEQKNRVIVKEAKFKAMKEADWRKLAIKSWEALLKEAELGSKMYEPDDSMIIGVLGEECFDNYKEYKELRQKHAGYDFAKIARAMIELNKEVCGSLEKISKVLDSEGIAGVKRLVKK